MKLGEWEIVNARLMQNQYFKNFTAVQTRQIKEIWSKMCKDVESRHSLGTSAGFESHPDIIQVRIMTN